MSDASTTAPSPQADLHASTLGQLPEWLGEGTYKTAQFRDNLRIYIEPDRLIEALQTLKERGGFEMLTELGGADYLEYPGQSGSGRRFEVHYALLNLETTERIIVKAGVDDPEPTLPSVIGIWGGADWMEREVYDMYGIRFEGHPDLRRILMPDEFTAFPLRKDYPLRGRGERHNFPRITRQQS